MVDALRVDLGVLLDLAHVLPRTFLGVAMDADGNSAQSSSRTPGYGACRDPWRNVDDIRVIAAAGVVGIIRVPRIPGRLVSAADVVRHIEHVIRVGGEEAGGSAPTTTGWIIPPRATSG